MIGIIDYGLGNVNAFLNAYRRLNIAAMPVRTAGELDGVARVILPGVGAFDHAMARLEASGMHEPLSLAATERGVPVLGVCVGMQILAASSEEGERAGLGLVPGRVRHLSAIDRTGTLQLPHMGWNDVRGLLSNPLFAGLEDDARFYFLHSYYFECPADVEAGTAEYGAEFSCAVRLRNIFGVQFHPEKSHHYGMRLLRNFAENELE
jgi:imidazole glycerol-phosphate synthase subunit HisH